MKRAARKKTNVPEPGRHALFSSKLIAHGVPIFNVCVPAGLWESSSNLQTLKEKIGRGRAYFSRWGLK